jgi:hypothetical protein
LQFVTEILLEGAKMDSNIKIWFIIVGLLFFVAAFIYSIDSVDFDYPELLAEEEDAYFMLTVDNPDVHPVYETTTTPSEELREVLRYVDETLFRHLKRTGHFPLMTYVDLEEVQTRFPKLNIEQAPSIVIFDNKGMIFKTYDMEEAKEFLKGLGKKVQNY